MAKKQLTPEEYRAETEKKALKAQSFANTFLSVIAVLLSLVITFSVFTTAQTFAKENRQSAVAVSPDAQQSVSDDGYISDDTAPSTDDGSIIDVAGDDAQTDGDASVDVTDDDSQPVQTDDEKKAFSSTEELVAYYNECANKVKTDAVKVVKNYEKREIGEIVVPGALQSTADTMINKYMADDTEPIVYDTKDAIKESFIVPGQDYVSCLKASDVVKAEYEDKGNEYVVYLKLKDEKNPRAGSGVGSACDVIETHEVAENAPGFLEEFSTYYYDCEITATIDKATGRMSHAVYSTPLKLTIVANLLGTHTVTAEIKFIKDYTISY